MILLILGVGIWSAAHLFKRLAPGPRGAMGMAGKGVVAVGILTGLVLMIWGYRVADLVPVYAPLPGMGHANNLLMLVAIYLYGVGGAKGRVSHMLRHPMLLGTIVWSVAHLLVNGDLASIILFGGIAVWAFVQMLAINLREGGWMPAHRIKPRGDLVNVGVTLVVYAVVSAIHIWLGRNPFLGSYG